LGVVAHVHSAGLLEEGNRAHTHGIDVLSQRGLDLSSHRSRAMTTDLIRDADLVLAMARQHVHEVVLMERDAFPRTFTLKELLRRARQVGPRGADEPLEGWLAKVHEGRTTRGLLGGSDDDDVEDPIGRPRAAYERMVAELDGLLDELVWLLWGEAGRARRERAS
jgi:protein-tyrosine phosphatase